MISTGAFPRTRAFLEPLSEGKRHPEVSWVDDVNTPDPRALAGFYPQSPQGLRASPDSLTRAAQLETASSSSLISSKVISAIFRRTPVLASCPDCPGTAQ